jgi:hypothetical protein
MRFYSRHHTPSTLKKQGALALHFHFIMFCFQAQFASWRAYYAFLAFSLSNENANQYQNGNEALRAAKLSALFLKVSHTAYYGMHLPF